MCNFYDPVCIWTKHGWMDGWMSQKALNQSWQSPEFKH